MGICNACFARDDGRSRRRVEAHIISGYVEVSDNGEPWKKVYVVLFSNSNLIWYSEEDGELLGRIELKDINNVMSLLMVGPACRRMPSCPDKLPRKVSYDYMMAIPQNYDHLSGMRPQNVKMLFMLLPNADCIGDWMKAIRSCLGVFERNRDEDEGNKEEEQEKRKKVKKDRRGSFDDSEPLEYGWGWGWGSDPGYGNSYKDFDQHEDYDDRNKTYQGDSHSVKSFVGSVNSNISMASATICFSNDSYNDHISKGSRASGAAAAAVNKDT